MKRKTNTRVTVDYDNCTLIMHKTDHDTHPCLVCQLSKYFCEDVCVHFAGPSYHVSQKFTYGIFRTFIRRLRKRFLHHY